jgi:hypothetical protein
MGSVLLAVALSGLFPPHFPILTGMPRTQVESLLRETPSLIVPEKPPNDGVIAFYFSAGVAVAYDSKGRVVAIGRAFARPPVSN